MKQRPKIPLSPRLSDPKRDLGPLNTFIRETSAAIGDLTDLGGNKTPSVSVVPKRPDQQSPNTVPLITFYQAGQELSDGTWFRNMYWDSTRQTMLIDNFVYEPSSYTAYRLASSNISPILPLRSRQRAQASINAAKPNWGGVQFWIQTPTKLVAATDLVTPDKFKSSAQGWWYRQTIEVGLESVPSTPENWTFIAASADSTGKIANDNNGVPLGPRITLQTLPKADTVINLGMSIQQSLTESGDQVFRLVMSWTNPTIPRYTGVRFILRGFQATDLVMGDAKQSNTSFSGPEYSIPDTTKNITVFAVSLFGDGSQGDINSSPSVSTSISRTSGPAGIEYANLVQSPTVTNLGYSNNADGQRVLVLKFAWTNPPDIRFGGVIIFADWFDGNRYEIPVNGVSTSLTWTTDKYPTSTPQSVTFWFVSVDRNLRRNTVISGTTPQVVTTLSPPGQVNVADVTNFVVNTSRRLRSDGTRILTLDISFTPPSDPRWGSVNIKTSEDGVTYKTRASTNQSPVSVEIVEPRSSVSISLYVAAYSVDVNGRENTTTSDIVTVFYGGINLLDLTMTDPSTVSSQFGKDPSTSQLKIVTIDGSLIVQGTIASRQLVTTGIDVGNPSVGAYMPARINVYNSSGAQVGFIGTDGSGNQGAWFLTMRAGGSSYTNAPFQVDSSGNLLISFSSGSDPRTFRISQTDTDAPFKISNVVTGRRVAIDAALSSGLGVVGIYAGNPNMTPLSYGDYASASLVAPVALAGGYCFLQLLGANQNSSVSLKTNPNPSSSTQEVTGVWQQLDLARSVQIYIDRQTTSYLLLSNTDLRISDGVNTYTGQTVSINYLRPDSTTGTLTFKRGVLTAAT